MKQILLRRWGLKVALLVVGVATVVADKKFGASSLDVTFAFILAVALLSLEQIFESNEQVEKLRVAQEAQIESLRQTLVEQGKQIDQIKELIGMKVADGNILRAADKIGGIVGASLKKTRDSFHNKVQLLSEGFSVANHETGLRSYAAFWEVMLDEQKKRRGSGQVGLTALVVHSCAPEIWNEPSLQSVLFLQREFFRHGGITNRILCGHGTTPKPGYLDLARKMVQHNIDVKYYDVDKGGNGYNFEWDFLLVKETGEAVIWRSVSIGGQIKEAVCTRNSQSLDLHLQNTWAWLVRESVEFPDLPIRNKWE